MGLGLQVSALHRTLTTVAGQTFREVPPGTDRITDLLRGPAGAKVLELASPGTELPFPPSAVIAWRNQISAKYVSQLTETLWWDEESGDLASEDLATSTLTNLRYIAARVTTDGNAVISQFVRTPRPNLQQQTSAIATAARRGFAGPFPQLLLEVDVWLPVRRNIIIEEPNPRGQVQRFGSLLALLAELESLRSRLLAADVSIAPWATRSEVAEHDLLTASWQAATCLHRATTLAIAKHLPLTLVT